MSLQPHPIPTQPAPPSSTPTSPSPSNPFTSQSPSTLHSLSLYLSTLLSRPSITESDHRPFTRPPYRSPLGFVGTDFVHGDGRYALRYFHVEGGEWPVVVVAAFGLGCEGVVGLVHGGCVAVVWDDVVGYGMGREERLAMTVELTVRYVRKVTCPSVAVLECREVSREGRKVRVEGRMTKLGGGEGQATDAQDVLSTCEALLIDSTGRFDPFTPYHALKAKL